MFTKTDVPAETRAEPKVRTERYRVAGEQLLARVRALVHEGNIRRIIIINEQGRAILEIPLTLGVVGAVLVPVWVALGAIAALAADYTLLVEKLEKLEKLERSTTSTDEAVGGATR